MALTPQCPRCGLTVSEGQTVCPNDGTPLGGPPAAPSPWDGEPTARRPAPRASGPKQIPPSAAGPGGYEPTVRRAAPGKVETLAAGPTELPGSATFPRASREHARPAAAAPNPFADAERTVRRDRDHAAPKTVASDPGTGDVDGTSATAEQDLMLGQRLGEYVVRERIGVGGMGIVYRGEQPVIGKPVAIKILRPDVVDKPIHMERLLAEARAVNAIRHRGIIDIFSFGQTPDGRQYFVMEYLDGQALDQYIHDRGVLTPHEALSISSEILGALAAAHEAGVIHRDLKPNNIFLVNQPGGGTYVKVLDFGLAKLGGALGGTTPQTQGGLIMGTPEYMAPEQIRGAAVSAKTDLYSFGIMAFQMVTGQLPFTAGSMAEYLVRHLEYAPPSPLALQPDLPPELAEWVLSLLAKDPDARPAMSEVRQRLRQLQRALPAEASGLRPKALAPPPPSRLPSLPPQVAPTAAGVPGKSPTQVLVDTAVRRRRMTPIAALAAAVLVLAAGAYFALRPSAPTPPAPTPPVHGTVTPPATGEPGRPAPTEATAAPAATAAGTADPAAPVAPGPEAPAQPAVASNHPPATTATPVKDAPVASPAVPAKTPAERREARVLARIRRLEQETPVREPETAREVLRKLRLRAQSASSQSELQNINDVLDTWELSYLR